MEETGLISLLRSVPCQGRAVQQPRVCSRRALGALQLPMPSLHLTSLSYPCIAFHLPSFGKKPLAPTAPAWPGDPAVGTAVGTAAGVPSCRRVGCGPAPVPVPLAGERQPRPTLRSPGQLPDLFVSRCAHLSAQPASGSQPRSGEEREKWCFAGWDGNLQPCGSLGQMSPHLRAKSQPGARQPFRTLEQGLALWQKEGSPVPLETGQENEQVDRAELGLGQACKTSPSVPRELRGHSQGRAAPARCHRPAGAVPAAGLQHTPQMPQCIISCL